MTVSPASGWCTGLGTVTWVTVTRCTDSLPEGTSQAQLTLHASEGVDRVVPVTVVVPAAPTDAELLATLRALPPLPKVHASVATSFAVLDNPDISVLQELVRITHTVEIHARWLVTDYVSRAVAACKNVNATNPAIPATIFLNYSPYHNMWPTARRPRITARSISRN